MGLSDNSSRKFMDDAPLSRKLIEVAFVSYGLGLPPRRTLPAVRIEIATKAAKPV